MSDSVDKFLLRLKVIKDELVSTWEKITENGFMIDVLSGLPPEFEVIKTIILARETSISLKDFIAHNSLAGLMYAMYINSESSNAQGIQGGY